MNLGDCVTTIPELHALPARTILLDGMGWVSVLTDDYKPDARGAYMTNMEGVRIVWEHHLPLRIIHLPEPESVEQS